MPRRLRQPKVANGHGSGDDSSAKEQEIEKKTIRNVRAKANKQQTTMRENKRTEPEDGPNSKKRKVKAIDSEILKDNKQDNQTANDDEDQVSSEVETRLPNSKAVTSNVGRKRTAPKTVQGSKKLLKVVVLPSCSRRHQRGPGVVLAIGQGDVGQLGLGENALEKSRPALVPMEKGAIVDVCAGGMHSVCLTDDGEVWTFGCNDEGALGRDTTQEGSEFGPAKVEVPGQVVQISAGDSHTAALTDDGRVFLWGNFRDSNGAMGLLAKDQKETKPLHVLPSVNFVKIASGSDHLVLLSRNGQVYTCGCAEQGQLGRVAECFANRGGRKGLDFLLQPSVVHVQRRAGKGIVFDDIWAGSSATFAHRKDSQEIYCCGLNNYNQIGFDDAANRFVLQLVPSFSGNDWREFSCGLHHTLALDKSGKVHVIGRKEYGRLGLGENTSDASLPTVVSALDDICVNVSCSGAVSYAVSKTGSIFAWGMGSNGQLASGGEDDLWEPKAMSGKQLETRRVVAVSCGGQHAVLLAKEETGSQSR